jgi:tetratricopeptide (TPR) repeat protein
MTDTLREHLQAALGGAYRVERELGGGGMGRVFVAEDTTLGRNVVVKVLPPELARGLSAERFRREIQLAAKLQHPHIVPLLAAGATEDGMLYYTMPFIDGDSLRQRLIRGGELPIPDALRILRQVVDALAYAHARGVVHRDIKPDNVLLSGNHALVTDFGVSKALSTATGPVSLTSLGVALGTPAYMAPEQAAADPNTDHRADIYAVGVLAYELLTGHPPFQGTSPQQVLAAHAAVAPPPISPVRASVSPQLEELVMRCLEKHAADRPQSAEEVLQRLESLSTPTYGTTPAPMQPVRARRTSRDYLGRAVAVGAAAGVLALAALGALWLRRDPPPEELVETRVLLGPFQNRTGEPSLDQMGRLASDAVGRMLVEQAGVEITELEGDGGSITDSRLIALARGKRASLALRGSYYRVGDSLQFEAAVLDSRQARVLRTVGPFRGPLSAPGEAIDPLAQRLGGGLAVMTRATLGRDLATTLPRFDAYREYLQGDETYPRGDQWQQTLRHFFRAYEIDTLYTWPLVRAAYVGANTGNCALTDSIAAVLAPARQRMGPGEAGYLDRVIAQCKGDYPAAYGAAVRMRRAAPESDEVAYIVAIAALQVNRPRDAVAAIANAGRLRRLPQFFLYHTNALHLLGDHQRELDVSREAVRAFPEAGMAARMEARALAALGRLDEADAVMRRAENLDNAGVPYGWMLMAHGAELTWHGHRNAARAYYVRAADWFEQLPPARRNYGWRADHVRALAAAGRNDEALARGRELLLEFPDSIEARTALGVAAVRAGYRAAADSADAWLARYTPPPSSGFARRGWHTAHRTLIAGARADGEAVASLIRNALSQGFQYTVIEWHNFPEVAEVANHPAVQAVARPRD